MATNILTFIHYSFYIGYKSENLGLIRFKIKLLFSVLNKNLFAALIVRVSAQNHNKL